MTRTPHRAGALGLRALSLALLVTASVAAAETRRVAILVGNNAGSAELPPLRFAENDAGKMARVLVELGEVGTDDVMLLQGRRVGDLERAIFEAKERVALFKKSPDVRAVLIFYFSGHSDGEAIELGAERLPYGRLKALLSGTGADVRLAIVDACRSGGGLREKGGKATDAFAIRLADTLNTTGEAFITSSAADEAALESSEVMGSYFTHNFISGLRGAADTSGDKVVTLAEAYRYAYERTVSATAVLPVGAQHPNYDFRLSGQGELMLTSLQRPSALLVLPEGADRSLVSDVARDQVVVEVPAGPREIALAPGQYGLRLFKGGQSFGGRVSLSEGGRKVVAWSELQPLTSSVLVAAKGGPLPQSVEVSQPVEPLAPPDTAPIGLALGFGVTRRLLPLVYDAASVADVTFQGRLDLEPVSSRFGSFNLFGRPRLGRVTVHGDLTLHLLGEWSQGDVIARAGNEAGGQFRLGYRVGFDLGRFSLAVGVEAGPGVIVPYETTNPPVAFVFAAGPRFGLRLRIIDALSLSLDGDVTFLGTSVKNDTVTEFRWFALPSASASLVFFF